jgi:phosphoglycolate phosphatase
MKKGIIFDLDGTLWNSTKQVMDSWNIIFNEKYPDICSPITYEQMEGYMGKTLDKIAELHLPNLSYEKRMKIMREACQVEQEYLKTHSGVVYPQVEETLLSLKNQYSFYCVSNSQDGYVQIFLEVTGLSYLFEDIEMAGRTGKTKAENISLVMERNNLDWACYVGDTTLDMEAALGANIPFIHAAYGFGNFESEYYIEKFSDLPLVANKLSPPKTI